MLKVLLLIILSALTACSENTPKFDDLTQDLKPNFQTNVVYGEDNRKDWYEVLDAEVKEAARATLGIFDNSSIRMVGGTAVVDARGSRLCPSEKFFNQKRGPICSGFLVGPDLVLTAGHCISSQSDCLDLKFAFDYAMTAKLHNPAQIPKENVYSCKTLVGRELTRNDQDWALVRLDRPVLDRSPLDIERTKSPALGMPLTIIGHPSGLPSKISRGGSIHDISSHHFVADLDSFGGNSGSAVLNAATLKVEGILVRGRSDYQNVNGCLAVNVCEEGIGTECKFSPGPIEGEHVSKTINLAHLIPLLEAENPEPEPEDPRSSDKFISKVMLPIPDSSLKKVYSKIENVPALTGSKSKVRLVVEHTYISDLRITLVAPDKTRLVLHGNTGRRVQNINGTYGADLSSFEPLQKLGAQPRGEWTLELTDQAPFDKGYLIEWEIIPSE